MILSFSLVLCAAAPLLPFRPAASAGLAFRIGIMQDLKGAATTYGPLLAYLRENGVSASFIAARSYSEAARMFIDGRIDGMFSGSGIAGCLIIKEAAYPIVRPVSQEGWSTYRAVVLAPKGSARFTQNADYFDGKRVIFCSLASSGEFYFQAIAGSRVHGATILKAASHGAAIDALARGAADVAVVKNRVWEIVREKYPNIVQVGEDPGENPDGALMISKATDPATVASLSNLLLGLGSSDSPQAAAVRKELKIKGYIKTTVDDFKFTIPLLKRAGVTADFDFSF